MTTNYLDVVWLTTCGILVFIMQAGFLCLEAGSTRSKNRVNIIVKNLTDLGVSVLIFWAVGYGLMFGNSWHGIVGMDRFLPDLGENKDMWTGSFFLFQAMFCSTAVTILSGASAERLKFKGYLAICILISSLIYPVFGHWVWQGIDRGLPGGWLAEKGFVDFAGSTVVHGIGGWCSLATVLVLGPRLGRFSKKRQFDEMASTDLPIAFLGTMLLWVGWFGFNGGSNLTFDANVANVIANTLIAGSAGVVTPIVLMSVLGRPVEVKPMMNGAIAALVSVTSGCHSFSSGSALLVGIVGSLLMIGSTQLLEKWKIDDVVGAIPVHLVAGTWGTLAVGFFGNLNRLGTGLSRFAQIKAQTEGVLACGIWAFSTSLVALLVFSKLGLLKVSPRQEYVGLNISEHGAKSDAEDLHSVMRHHARSGDLRRRVKGDPFTEVGRVGQWYNQVISALDRAVSTNEAIINTALDGIFTLTTHAATGELRIQSANPAAEKLFGYAPKNLIGRPFQELLASKLLFTKAQLTDIVRATEPMPMVGAHCSSQSFPIELTATETTTKEQQFFTVFIKDISARRLAEDALLDSRAQERAKAAALEHAMVQLRRTQAQLIQRERMAGQGQLVAGIAHEINNPTSFIHGNLNHAKDYVEELLSALEQYRAHYAQHGGKLSEEARSQLQTNLEDIDIDYIAADFPKLISSMQTGTTRIRSIVEQLRNFSRYDETDLKAVDIHEGLDSTLMVLAHRLKATSRRPEIKVTRQYSKLPNIECYAGDLNRAALNIITNAIDAFDRLANEAVAQGNANPITAPRIMIKTRLKGDRISLIISNNGPHIPEGNRKRIFDPFFTTQPIGKGPGLGCTISYQIVTEQHNGQLTCQSAAGKDTDFELTLPLKQTAANKVKDPSNNPVQPLSLVPSPSGEG